MRYIASTLGARVDGASVIRVTDHLGSAEHGASLTEVGFVHANESFYKIRLPGVWEPAAAAAEIARMDALPEQLASTLDQQFKNLDNPESFLRLERIIAPGKILSSNKVPCFVIPIRPHWARALFDGALGERGLWDEDADLLFNPSSAYYTGARLSAQQGRLLWYVSSSETYKGTKRIRACSQLRGTVVDKPLELYRRFRHYGVFSLADVQQMASKQRPEVMALEFSDTELLQSPVPLERIREILANETQVFQWPTRVSESQFFKLYESGISDAPSLNKT